MISVGTPLVAVGSVEAGVTLAVVTEVVVEADVGVGEGTGQVLAL